MTSSHARTTAQDRPHWPPRDPWRIVLLNTKDRNPNRHIVRSIERALAANEAVDAVFNVGYADALPAALRERCNLLLAVDGQQLDRGLCSRLRSVCGRSALWVFEDPYEQRVNLANADLFDLVYTTNSASVSLYGQRGVHLPLAADSRFHEHTIPEADRQQSHYLYDLFFAGTPWPNRIKLLKTLLGALGDLRIKLALPGNDAVVAKGLGLPESCYSWRIANSELARMANHSRIVLCLDRQFTLGAGTARAATPGPRLFEVALAGGFQLAERTAELADYYAAEREIATFSSADEAVARIRHYLRDSAARLDMARAAQQRTRVEHLYEHRVAKLLAHLPRPRSVRHLPTSRPRTRQLLLVAHNHVSCKPFGGVEVYADLLSRNLPAEYNPYLMFPDRRSGKAAQTIQVIEARTGKRWKRRFRSPLSPHALTDPAREDWFARFLHRYQIDIVHFLHLIGHPWSLPFVARTLGVPTVLTVMDHLPVCAHFNLLRCGRYCNLPALPATACDLCLLERDNLPAHTQRSRRAYIGSVLKSVDTIIPLSDSARDILVHIYPDLPRNSKVVVEGLPVQQVKAAAPADRRKAGRLQVAVPGNFLQNKGADTLCRVFNALRDDPIDFHIFGHVAAQYAAVLHKLALPHVKIHGGYAAGASFVRLAACDVALLLSNWPETYMLTLSESWQAGTVPIVADIGALRERVEHGINGFKVPVDEPGSVVHLIRQLIAEPDRIAEIRAEIHPGLYRLLDDHLDVVTGLYDELVQKYRLDRRPDSFYSEEPRERMAGGANSFRPETAPMRIAGSGAVDARFRLPKRLRLPQPTAWQRLANHVKAHGWRKTAVRMLEKVG